MDERGAASLRAGNENWLIRVADSGVLCPPYWHPRFSFGHLGTRALAHSPAPSLSRRAFQSKAPSQQQSGSTGHPKGNGLAAVCNTGTSTPCLHFLLMRQELWDSHNARYAMPFLGMSPENQEPLSIDLICNSSRNRSYQGGGLCKHTRKKKVSGADPLCFRTQQAVQPGIPSARPLCLVHRVAPPPQRPKQLRKL